MGDRDYFHHSYEGPRKSSFWATHAGTKGLLIGLGVIHILMAVLSRVDIDAYIGVVRVLALSPERLLSGWIWQLLTYALLHDLSSIFHILFNCLVLWWFGSMVEGRMGLRRYLGFCAAATVVGGLAQVGFQLAVGSAGATMGASGFVMGLTILAACWNPRVEILLFFVLRVQLWVAAVVIVGINLVGMLTSSGGGTAFAAHLGGALYGWIYFKYGNRIEGVFASIDRMAAKADRKKERKKDATNAELRQEIDRILDKVNREGMTSLSDQERKFLKRASKKLNG
ncbi:MAG: rhomboid family intramembrane serine protease [Planctomycetota bacterium]|jgi:membrane associated rhomboid family serine protease